jgi:hypothetical protein
VIERNESDAVVGIECKEDKIVIVRSSGLVEFYNNLMERIGSFSTSVLSVRTMYLNSDSTQLALIDQDCVLRIYKIDTTHVSKEIVEHDLVLMDIWSFVWALDDANSFAAMDKHKLMISQNNQFQEVSPASGCISFTFRLIYRLDAVRELPSRSCAD